MLPNRMHQVREAWRNLDPRRRSALASLALMTVLLLTLVLYQRPRTAPPGNVGPQPAGLGALADADHSDPAVPAGFLTEATTEAPATSAAAPPEAQPEAPALQLAAPAPPTVDPGELSAPVVGEMQRGFGWMHFPALGDWRLHAGVDYAAPADATVYAAASGIVDAVKEDPLWGRAVILNHGAGRRSHYAGLARVSVEPGQKVERGVSIGQVGSGGTAEPELGTHLHFAVEVDGTLVNPVEHLK